MINQMNMEWFESWFDSPLYEQIYRHRDDDEALLLHNLISELYPPKEFSNILDLACGRGRHSIHLARSGYRVTGIDLSENAINVANKKAFEEGLNINFMIGDMRNRHDASYDLIVNLFTSFGYFREDSDNIKVIENVGSMLKPNGIFIQDFLNAGRIVENLKEYEAGMIEGYSYEIRRSVNNDMVSKEITFTDLKSNNKQVFQEEVKLFDLDWFKKTYQGSGLKLFKTFGSYTRSSFDPDTSPRLIMISGVA